MFCNTTNQVGFFTVVANVTMHNVLFGQHVFLPTEQAETYLKIYALIYHSTYICSSLFGWKEKLYFQGNRDFQTLYLGFLGHFDHF